jgi:hypothetical protein
MNSRPASDLHFVNKREPLPTVEVSVDSLQENQLSLDAIVAPVLRRLAAAHPELRATVGICSTPSVNFHAPGYSEFLIVGGPDKVLNRIHSAFDRTPGVRCRFSDSVRLDRGTLAYHLEDGQLWEPEDSLNWFAQAPSAPPATAPDAEAETSPQVWPVCDESDEAAASDSELASSEAEAPANRGSGQAARYRAARSDATIARIRQTIEEVFGLPAGSVALCGPDGRALRGDAFIKTLRRRWEES